MLVLLYIPNSPEIIVAASTSIVAVSTAFSNILLLSLFYFYRN